MRWLAEVRWTTFQFSRGDCLAHRYRVEKPLGHGGRGEVYAVHDRLLRQAVALKTLERTCRDPRGTLDGLLAEVRLARRLAHPNVCRIYDMGVHVRGREHLHFATMQLVPGRNLEHVLLDRRPSVASALPIARQVLLGLHAMHRADVLHRDVRSANIMLASSQGTAQAVLINFGRAQCLRDPALTSASPAPAASAYTAPEQSSGLPLSPKADLFSLGVVLYEMLTGRRPFANLRASAADAPQREPRILPPSHYTVGVPPELDALVLRCLAPDPERRYEDAGALLCALDALPA